MYLERVRALVEEWRSQLRASGHVPRADAAAWVPIDVLPAHPVLTAPVAAAATGRGKAPMFDAIRQLVAAGVLVPLTHAARNQSWEAVGLLEVIAGMEEGRGG